MFETFYPGQELDLATIERHAYADGDIRTAQLAALALDAAEEAARLEDTLGKELAEAEDAYVLAQEAWGRHNEAMRTKFEELRQVLEITSRVSQREHLLQLVGECLDLIDKAED